MPLFVCDSRFNRESRLLRAVARNLGWETLRVDGWELPDWVETDKADVAIFATAPASFDIAEKFERTLLGCGPDWLIGLPFEFLRRDIRRTALADALHSANGQFVKGAITKALLGKVYSSTELRHTAKSLSPDL